MTATTTDGRTALHKLMVATIADAINWTYLAVRPMAVPLTWRRGQKVRGDCSKGVQFLCRWAGLADPMKQAFGPYGNSQTLWLCLQHLDHPSQLLVGDVVTFGTDGDEHAAMVMEAGNDPLLWSFGHQGAPNSYRLSQDGRPAQYLRVPVPVYIPTGKDRLRSRTGWFAWVAWKLGEGDWQDYKKADKTVRPKVSRVISPSWWKRYAAYMLRRKKANPANPASVPA